MGWAVGRGDVGWEGVGGKGDGKNHRLGHLMSSHSTHTVANDTSQWEQAQVPTAQLAPSVGAIVSAVSLEGRQNAFHKSRPVNICDCLSKNWPCLHQN